MTSAASASRVAVVSFDAGGTLLEVSEPVGETYARFARAEGFDVTAAAMEDGFRRATAASPPLAAPDGTADDDLLAFERAWWRRVVDASLDHALGSTVGGAVSASRTQTDAVPEPRAAARERFFDAAFAHYARGAAWRLLPGALDVLDTLRDRGLRLIVLSNFDRRLHALLDELGIAARIELALASSEARAAKPARAIFDRARARLGVDAAACLHVGDSLREDVHGAVDAGWGAIWLERSGRSPDEPPAGVPRITTLAAIPDVLHSSSA